jgi:hypothetical protein
MLVGGLFPAALAVLLGPASPVATTFAPCATARYAVPFMCDAVRAAWPLLHEVASAGVWCGQMHYATGKEGLQPAPFTLEGTTSVRIRDEATVSITSTVTLPNGAERTVNMEGTLGAKAGSTTRLETVGGPISLLLSEHTAAGTILMREVNRTTDAPIVTSSMVLLRGVGDEAVPELLQTAHELSPGASTSAPATVSGVQMWRMRPQASLPDVGDEENDEEAYMYSGSEL